MSGSFGVFVNYALSRLLARPQRLVAEGDSQLVGYIVIDRAGVSLLLLYTKFRKLVENLVGLDLEFSRQLINSNLLHSGTIALTTYRQVSRLVQTNPSAGPIFPQSAPSLLSYQTRTPLIPPRFASRLHALQPPRWLPARQPRPAPRRPPRPARPLPLPQVPLPP